MNISQPIKNEESLKRFKNYYYKVKYNPRNYLLITMGINTALRISDLLLLKWKDLFYTDEWALKTHIELYEKKTGKHKLIYINDTVRSAIFLLYNEIKPEAESYIFCRSYDNTKPISRMQAYRIVRRAASECEIAGVISCHSMRKTFGYHARKKGTDISVLVSIYNHSSYNVTKRYLGIDQDDQDEVYSLVQL